MKYYLAIDIGASSGRHILAHQENEKMMLEEIHRFPNGMVQKNGHLVWNVDTLFQEIKTGMKKCAELEKIPESVGIDTWAVDFVLLDRSGKRIGDAVAYRDNRTNEMDKEIYKLLSEDELYQRTGIQKQMFNSIYQLMALKKNSQEELNQAEKFLMIPDYFHYLLTGVATQEYTNATTTQLVNPQTNDWDWELIKTLGYPEKIFQPIQMPGTELGNLTPELQQEIGFDCKVTLPATHDTASAVMAVPTESDEALYISSGTWSLMGTELMEASCSKESKEKNLTNEGGYDYRFRFLKNIMGLWMIQSVRHEFDDAYSFAQLCEMAEEVKKFPSRVDVNDDCFLAPANMTGEIKDYCTRTNQPIPETVGEIATVIYQSLAESYAETVKEIESISGKKFEAIHIVGGGSNAAYLNDLTAEKSGLTVYAGPGEATAIGNLVAQMIKAGEFKDLQEARSCIFKSFEVKQYETR